MIAKNLTQNSKKEAPKKINLQYQRDKDRELVSGIAKNYECPGGTVEFVYKEYKGDPVEKYSFMDGEVCRVPRGVARHMNKNCWYPVHSHSMDENGKANFKIGLKVQRFGFQSLEFMEDDNLSGYVDNEKSLVTVEKVSIPLMA